MIVVRILAWFFLLATLVAGGAELIASLQAGAWTPLQAGTLWFKANVYSLNLVQAIVQRYIYAPIWDPGIVTILLWPTWVVTLIPGVVLMLIGWYGGRKKEKRRRGFR